MLGFSNNVCKRKIVNLQNGYKRNKSGIEIAFQGYIF